MIKNSRGGFDLREMVRQSVGVITQPSVRTFELFERAGGLTQGVTYVAITSVLVGIVAWIANALPFINSRLSFWETVLGSLFGYLAYVFTVHAVGRAQGGTGTLDEVAYTFALFWAPLAILFALLQAGLVITIVGILLVWLVPLAQLVVNTFFAYTGVQSSMNIRSPGAIVPTLLISLVTSVAVQALVRWIVP
ncbi:hypothetical protein [Deinococcus pimensis]|uniref:hypothetical protein n=1 Tax=Deinococcus pimensis TaxID=309888 RepID=UPI0004871652|nr:hypothetical protein [Deinococcus pimensis]